VPCLPWGSCGPLPESSSFEHLLEKLSPPKGKTKKAGFGGNPNPALPSLPLPGCFRRIFDVSGHPALPSSSREYAFCPRSAEYRCSQMRRATGVIPPLAAGKGEHVIISGVRKRRYRTPEALRVVPGRTVPLHEHFFVLRTHRPASLQLGFLCCGALYTLLPNMSSGCCEIVIQGHLLTCRRRSEKDPSRFPDEDTAPSEALVLHTSDELDVPVLPALLRSIVSGFLQRRLLR